MPEIGRGHLFTLKKDEVVSWERKTIELRVIWIPNIVEWKITESNKDEYEIGESFLSPIRFTHVMGVLEAIKEMWNLAIQCFACVPCL